MNFETIENKRINEKVLYTHHSSGLDIYIVPKKDFTSQYAIFGTKYGSIDMKFETGSKMYEVPAGIAHYLEHKMFESEEGDAFSQYAKNGADANAYTSFDRTCYLFSSTSKFLDSLEILLKFVQNPYFTEQTVQKEQGIIGQEVRMYEDNPEWRVFFNLLGALYYTHPVKIDIAGTIESIAKITPELLYQCYNTFYNLNNMALCVAGDIDPEAVIKVADRLLKPCKPLDVKSIFESEPDNAYKSKVEQKLSVSIPLFTFGFKDEPDSGASLAKREALTQILLRIICGPASPLYAQMYDSGLINDSLSTQYEMGRGYAITVVGGESHAPEKVRESFMGEVERLKTQGIDAQIFEEAKRAVYGRFVSQYDSVDNVANSTIGCRFVGMEPFDVLEAVANATLEDVQKRLSTHFTEEKCALSVINPIQK